MEVEDDEIFIDSGPEELEEDNDDEEEYEGVVDVDEFGRQDDVVRLASVCPALTDDIKRANQHLRHVEEMLGQDAVLRKDDVVFVNVLLNVVPESVRRMWDISDCSHISIRIKVCVERFRQAAVLPQISSLPMDYFTEKPRRPVSEHLTSIAKKFLTEAYWSADERPTDSFFLALYLRLVDRLPTLTDYCVICDNEHLGGGRLLPSICRRDFCCFQYDELGLYEDFMCLGVSAHVLDLLLSLFAIANNSTRREDIFYPRAHLKIPSTSSSNDVIFTGIVQPAARQAVRNYRGQFDMSKIGEYSEKQQFNLLFSSLPCARKLTTGEFLKEYKEANPFQGALIRWVLSSCGAYLQYVPPANQIESLHAHHQYLIIADSPKKHERFQQLKASHNGQSRFLFHGSPIENWHSIIRHGLWVASGTKYQINGAAYGKGIYLSDQMSVSVGYANSSNILGGERCLDECCVNQIPLPIKVYSMLAICEVVNNPQVLVNQRNSIYTLNDPDYCCVRMLLLLTNQFDHGLKGHISAADEIKIHQLVADFTQGKLEDRLEKLQFSAETA